MWASVVGKRSGRLRTQRQPPRGTALSGDRQTTEGPPCLDDEIRPTLSGDPLVLPAERAGGWSGRSTSDYTSPRGGVNVAKWQVRPAISRMIHHIWGQIRSLWGSGMTLTGAARRARRRAVFPSMTGDTDLANGNRNRDIRQDHNGEPTFRGRFDRNPTNESEEQKGTRQASIRRLQPGANETQIFLGLGHTGIVSRSRSSKKNDESVVVPLRTDRVFAGGGRNRRKSECLPRIGSPIDTPDDGANTNCRDNHANERRAGG